MRLALIAVLAVILTGCVPPSPGGDPGPVAATLALNEGLGTFDVQAGQPLTRTGTVTFDTTGNLQGGTFEVTPESIGVTPAQGKEAVRFQGGVLSVTVFLASADAADTVCESSDQYGPYSITLDESNNPVDVSPDTVELSDATLALIEAGEFSICIEVVSPIDGTVTIDSFVLNLEF